MLDIRYDAVKWLQLVDCGTMYGFCHRCRGRNCKLRCLFTGKILHEQLQSSHLQEDAGLDNLLRLIRLAVQLLEDEEERVCNLFAWLLSRLIMLDL